MQEPRFVINDNWTGRTTYLTTEDVQTALFLAKERLIHERKEQERGHHDLLPMQRDDGHHRG